MEGINTFITDNFIIIVVIAVFLIMTIIGYIAKMTGFGEKISARNQKNNKSTLEIDDENIETLNDENLTNNTTEADKLDALDTIAPNFNDGGLVIGDVNQNPAVTNQELGISEDLYAPFGDNTKDELSLDDIKIEEVAESDDFNIIERDKQNNEETDELIIQDVNPTTQNEESSINIENIKIEEAETADNTISEVEPVEKLDPVVEEINDLVDNTFVINDATSDFDNTIAEAEETENNEGEASKELSKVEQFDIGENELTTEDTNDFEIEATTNLKLDEINEKIKNLKLEDLDNQNLDEDVVEDIKKPKKKKVVSVKSVDEIKKDSSKNKNKDKDKDIDVVTDLPLPNLNEVGEDKDVSEEDDIWNF